MIDPLENSQTEEKATPKKRGPKKKTSETAQQTRKEGEHKPKGRPERVSMVAGAKLTIPVEYQQDEDHYYRWFADEAGRVDQAEAAYYEKVKDGQGNLYIRKGPVDMILMRLPMKYRLEDLKLKKQKVKATMVEEQKLGDDEYIPEGRRHALQRDDIDPLA